MLGNLFKPVLRLFLKPPVIRRWVAFEIRHRHYIDLEVQVPLGHGLRCPVAFEDAWASYEQVFFTEEYDRAWTWMPLPRRWLDLGCHAGFFSLYIIWRRRKLGLDGKVEALMIDADQRVRSQVEKLILVNRLTEELFFECGAIAAETSDHQFAQRDQMKSSLLSNGAKQSKTVTVSAVTEKQILERMSPPYDLIKADIEGGEFALLTAYPEVLRQTKHLILEWHSWHTGGGGREQIQSMVEQEGFRLVGEVVAPLMVSDPVVGQVGVLAFSRIA